MKKSIVIVIISLIYQTSFGQNPIILNGKILNVNGQPISTVHIQVDKTQIGTVSNAQGIFSLKVDEKYCESSLLFSHINYHAVSRNLSCNQSDYAVTMTERVFELNEVKVLALSAEQIILKAIANLDKNYQVDSVNYVMFSRHTEELQTEPLLIEESAFNLYHEDKTKPEFHIIKVRGKGFNKLGKMRFDEARLIGIHTIENHLMLRYIPEFLNKNRMNKYDFKLIDEQHELEDLYYVIEVKAKKANDYLKGGKVLIHNSDWSISYLEKVYEGQDYKSRYMSHYNKFENKYFFTHGSIEKIRNLKNEHFEIKSRRITVATERSRSRRFDKSEEMGRMSKMLSEFKGNFGDDFWDAYNFVPLEEKFKRSLTNAKNP